MSEMSSFYGGRQGVSFVIVKTFDGIDIPQPNSNGIYTYTEDLYAVDLSSEDAPFIVTTEEEGGNVPVGIYDSTTGKYVASTTDFLIQQTSSNINTTGYGWKRHANDGTAINDSEEFIFMSELAEGMLQCFELGAKTTSLVSYGEYVMIDTNLNMHQRNNPDNGKVYRRGLNINNDYFGGEYVGQVCGPQGESPEFDISTYEIVSALDTYIKKSYNALNHGIVAGAVSVNDSLVYNDDIKYAWATIKDEFGNVTGCKLGFQFPTLVEDFEAKSTSPYINRAKDEQGNYYNYNLVNPDSNFYTNAIKTFAINDDGQFILGTSTTIGAYAISIDSDVFYLIEKSDETESSYDSWQAISLDGNTSITTSDGNTYTVPSVKEWVQPFYQKWKIDIPHGYHGINPENIEIVHTYTKSPNYKGDSIVIYNTSECSDDDIYLTLTNGNTSYPLDGTDYKYIASEADIESDDIDGLAHVDKILNRYYMRYGGSYDADPNVIYAKITLNGNTKYVKKTDCYMDIIRYREEDFDDDETGINRYFYIGDYDTVDRVTLSEDGTLSVFYTAKQQPAELEQLLRWIDTKDTQGITIDDDGTLHIYYNTLHEETDPDTGITSIVHDHQDYPNILDWITQVTLSQDGQFTVLYNNNTMNVGVDAETGNPIQSNRYATTLQWIDYVNFTSDGTVTFRWNTDTTRQDTPAYQFINQIKYLYNVDFQSTTFDASDSRKDGYEGSGDQKIHIQYNNDGHQDTPIGVPLNYIIETCISAPTSSYPNAPYSHLLVYYSDPALRLKYKDKWVVYPSTKIIDDYSTDVDGNQTPIYHIWSEWIDLGDIRGTTGGIHVIKNVSAISDLIDTSTGNYIPPEQLTENASTLEGTIINPNGAGWACTCDISDDDSKKQILFYDYNLKEWYSIGSIDSDSVEPSYVVIKSAPDSNKMPLSIDVGILKTNGIWLASETAIFAS